MARKTPLIQPGSVLAPRAQPQAEPSVMESILDNHRKKTGRVDEVLIDEGTPEIPRNLGTKEPTYHGTEESGKLGTEEPKSAPTPQKSTLQEADVELRDRARALSTPLSVPVSLHISIPEELERRLGKALFELKQDRSRRGITKQGMVIAILEEGLAKLEEEIEQEG